MFSKIILLPLMAAIFFFPSQVAAQVAAPPSQAALEAIEPVPSPADTKPSPADKKDDIVARELAEALAAHLKGDSIGALDSLWLVIEQLWQQAPLGVRNVAFVTEQPENFGSYKPKDGETFIGPEPLILYCEPVGFTQLKEGDSYRYSIVGAFDILDAEGKWLAGRKNLGPYEQRGYRTFSTETMLVMTIGIHGLPTGP
ncbi:MAG: hypothetical protein ACRCTY_03865, partial [Candidatus Adiutrix sp.]